MRNDEIRDHMRRVRQLSKRIAAARGRIKACSLDYAHIPKAAALLDQATAGLVVLYDELHKVADTIEKAARAARSHPTRGQPVKPAPICRFCQSPNDHHKVTCTVFGAGAAEPALMVAAVPSFTPISPPPATR
jgi:hypothetical protein